MIVRARRVSFLISLILGVVIAAVLLKRSDKGVNVDYNHYDLTLGRSDAAHTLVIYNNYRCGYCRRFFQEVYPQLKRDYIDNGSVRLLVKNIEFTGDKQMREAIQLMKCGDDSEVSQKLHQLLLVNSEVVATPQFRAMYDDIMFGNAHISQCCLEHNNFKHIGVTNKEFEANHFTGTPVLVFKNVVYRGFKSYEQLKAIVAEGVE